MNLDEFAFFNQQLAAMLREGMPLEGALKQLTEGMKSDSFRGEIERLRADLAGGMPFQQAISRRDLPPFYVSMIETGVRGNDLPGALTLVADYYHRSNAVWTRLKGLMVYPAIVIIVSLALTTLVSIFVKSFLMNFFDQMPQPPGLLIASIWTAPTVLAIAAAVIIVVFSNPAWRAAARWRLPAFKEASLAQIGAAIAMVLKTGTPLPDALRLAENMEANTSAARALAQWRQCLETGAGKPSQWPMLKPFPPMFVWLVQQSGEDVAAGFKHAADAYASRASFRIEMLLYGALPVSMLLLAQMILWQAIPLFRTMIWFMNMLGSTGD
jgi:type II secretory pathway component PulF